MENLKPMIYLFLSFLFALVLHVAWRQFQRRRRRQELERAKDSLPALEAELAQDWLLCQVLMRRIDAEGRPSEVLALLRPNIVEKLKSSLQES